MEIQDEVLIQRILNKDKQALYQFYQRYRKKLLFHIQQKIDKEQDVEEVFQDTFFAFLEAIRDFHGQSKVQTFLYAICNHKIIDFYRRKKIKHVVFSQVPQLEMLISPLVGPDQELDATEMKEKIKKVLDSLPPVYRQVLTYKYIEGYSVEWIANTMRLTFKSVESKLFRARKAFVAAYER
jgi:RNA polymerase sigma-70 factor (ECF subfamily)